jgi:hypothetical protein
MNVLRMAIGLLIEMLRNPLEGMLPASWERRRRDWILRRDAAKRRKDQERE